ncbi:hypothetical protein N7537_011628 [Penicillium hordei]|uniref:Uncharacterized protein n=1 Tax=Penicillium hordei TaxID=40994 RepID=A0AAD6DM48_9EURO|nr:uncharacterized protein N7537_011628 [Penicillium hordei]KAJ5588950.1 hypothetical protein N7537_011628 [Penicillium hordei]
MSGLDYPTEVFHNVHFTLVLFEAAASVLGEQCILLVSFHNKKGLDFLDNTPTQQIIAVAKEVAAVMACMKAAKANVGKFALQVVLDKARLPAQHDPLVELHNPRAEQSRTTRGQARSTTCNPTLRLGR